MPDSDQVVDLPDGRALARWIDQQAPETLVFDLDGTIASIDLPWPEWEKRLLDLIPPDARGAYTLASGDASTRQRYLNRLHMEGRLAAPSYNQELASFESQATRVKANFDVLQAIRRQSDTRCVCVWTSNSHSLAHRVIAALQLADSISLVVAREGVRNAKPAPDGWQIMADRGREQASTLFIGDSTADRDAAAEAGIRFGLCTWGNATPVDLPRDLCGRTQ